MSRSRTIDIILFISFLLFFAVLNPVILRMNSRAIDPVKAKSKKRTHMEFNSTLLKLSSIGQQRAMSALLWMETLLSSDYDHHVEENKLSWMYYRFENISELDPYFFNNYLDGGLYLSVIKDDIIGAEKIFEKGLKLFPYDYWLNFYSGFNHYFEIGDTKGALNRFLTILYHPLTYRKYYFVSTLTIRMQSESGLLEESLFALKSLFESEQDEARRNKLKNLIYSTQAEIDLNCLNSSKNSSHCRRLDAEGNPYLFRNGKWTPAKEWKPIRTRNFDKDNKKKGTNNGAP